MFTTISAIWASSVICGDWTQVCQENALCIYAWNHFSLSLYHFCLPLMQWRLIWCNKVSVNDIFFFVIVNMLCLIETIHGAFYFLVLRGFCKPSEKGRASRFLLTVKFHGFNWKQFLLTGSMKDWKDLPSMGRQSSNSWSLEYGICQEYLSRNLKLGRWYLNRLSLECQFLTYDCLFSNSSKSQQHW